MEYEVTIAITVHVSDADSQEEADRLVEESIEKYGLPSLELDSNGMVQYDEG